jgi:hypothetical protein
MENHEKNRMVNGQSPCLMERKTTMVNGTSTFLVAIVYR